MNDDIEYKIENILAEETENLPEAEVKILNAAVKNFSKKGYHNTKTKDIAQDAGIAEGTIFRYFKTKEDILLKMYPIVIKIVLPKLLKGLVSEIKKKGKLSPEELAIFIIVDRMKLFESNQKLFRATIPEMFHRDEVLQFFKEEVFSKIHNTLLELCKEVLDDHYLIDSHYLSQFIITTLIGMVLTGLLLPNIKGEKDTETEVRQYVEMMSRGWRRTE